MIFEIPLDPSIASFTQETDMDGTTYSLTFRWNAREGAWYLTIADLDGAIVLASTKLVGGANLLRYSNDSRKPPGALLTEGTPTRDNLGKESRLIYYDASETA